MSGHGYAHGYGANTLHVVQTIQNLHGFMGRSKIWFTSCMELLAPALELFH
jgi:hypothetical protein